MASDADIKEADRHGVERSLLRKEMRKLYVKNGGARPVSPIRRKAHLRAARARANSQATASDYKRRIGNNAAVH